MNKSRYLLLFSFFLFLSNSVSAETSLCLKYEPEIVELKGEIKRIVFPGPPNYESVKNGDEPEIYWVLNMPVAICVQGDPTNDLNTATEMNVKTIQLMINDYEMYRPLLGKNVTVRGKMMHSFTGHHHTPVLIQVESMAKTVN